MKILNLFAGIGGNRSKWTNCEVTAVEYDPKIAAIYQKRFPNDTVIVGDAYEYLEQHFAEFEFIWASPPCPTHSSMMGLQKEKRLPDMRLYGIILFLKTWFKGKFCVENVRAYYKPLLPPVGLGRHYFWTNFPLYPERFAKTKYDIIGDSHRSGKFTDKDAHEELCRMHEVDLAYTGKNVTYVRNCVDWRIGRYILHQAFSQISLKIAKK